MALFIAWHEPERQIAPETLAALDSFELRPGLRLITTELTRSRLYHRVKWALPAGTALLVAPLGEAPKFKL